MSSTPSRPAAADETSSPFAHAHANRNFTDAGERGGSCSSSSSSGGGGPDAPSTTMDPSRPAAAASAVAPKKKKSLSARALKLFKSSLRRSASSARTVLTATPSCGDASSCGFDDASCSFRLGGGAASATGLSSSQGLDRLDDVDDANDADAGGDFGDAEIISHDRSSDDDDDDEKGLTDPEAMGRARALHARGRRHHTDGQFEEAAARHAEALKEMGRCAQGGDAPEGHGRAGAEEADVLRARISHDLARARYSFAAATSSASLSSSSNGDEVDLRRLADEFSSSKRALHQSMASHLERRGSSSLRPAGSEGEHNGGAGTVDLSDSAARADLLRAAGRIRDERLFEYDAALRCYGEALALEVRALEELDGRMAAMARQRGRSQVGGGSGPPKLPEGMVEARKTLQARVEETRRMIGRIHYKRGEFGMAVRASLG